MITSTGTEEPGRRIRAIVSGRVPILTLFGCILLVNWGVAIWLINYAYHQRETLASQMVNDEARYSAQQIATLIKDADRALLDLRSRRADGNGRLDLEHATRLEGAASGAAKGVASGGASGGGGIAFIAPDGHVVTATPRANTAGWPRLMTRLASAGDTLAIGEAIPAKNGLPGFVPVARRVVEPDGTFAGILMYSLESGTLSRLSPPLRSFDGCMELVTDDDAVLARTPEVRGAVGIQMTRFAVATSIRDGQSGIDRAVSPIDGIDRLFSTVRLPELPVTVIVGIGRDAIFADYDALKRTAIGTRIVASSLILLAAFFWYTRRRRAAISGDAFSAILSSVEQGIRVEDRHGRVVAANDAGASLLLPRGAAQPAETRQPDGGIVRIERHELADGGAVVVGTDATARYAAEARIAFLTSHDRLTGLPNRWLAVSRIEELIARKSDSTRMAALILFDLDGFQDINDTMGHEGGDEVLTEIADRLRDLVSGRDVAARLGGDEFLLFLDNPDDEATITELARQLPRDLARPITVRGQQVRLGATLGIALYPRDGADVSVLFQHANIALSRAKMAGRGTAQSFEPAMMVSFEEHRLMESDLRRALDSDELELCLQPQFSCETLDVTGFEALARWRHPTRGLLSPTMFIPIAERSGLINPLGLWAIEQACKAAAGWRTRQRVAVNLSPSQLRCETIQEDIRRILRRTQFPAHLLELEVTESVLLDEDQRTLETLHRLRAMDIRVTLDDFGAGYSSLSYLRRFPFDKIKIDKSFIQGQETDRGTRVILEAMIRMCTDLGFEVVAEGVETEHQLTELRRLGCREIQGFLLGEPLLPGMVEEFLVNHARRAGAGARHVRDEACAP